MSCQRAFFRRITTFLGHNVLAHAGTARLRGRLAKLYPKAACGRKLRPYYFCPVDSLLLPCRFRIAQRVFHQQVAVLLKKV